MIFGLPPCPYNTKFGNAQDWTYINGIPVADWRPINFVPLTEFEF